MRDLGGLAANAFNFQVEVEARCEANGAQQAKLVLGVAELRIADGADDSATQIAAAQLNIIEDCSSRDRRFASSLDGESSSMPLMVKSRRRTSSRGSVV